MEFVLNLLLGFVIIFLLPLITNFLPGIQLGLAGLGSLPRLALIGGLPFMLNFLLNAGAEGYLPPVPLGGIIPILGFLSVIVAGLLLLIAIGGFRQSSWSKMVRAVYGLVVVAAVFIIPFLGYWQLIGSPL